MGDRIYWAPVAGMVNVKNRHQQIIDRFYDGSFHQPPALMKEHQLIFQVFSDFGYQTQSLKEKLFQQFSQITFVCITFTFYVLKELLKDCDVIVSHICRSDYKVDYLSQIVDYQVQFQWLWKTNLSNPASLFLITPWKPAT